MELRGISGSGDCVPLREQLILLYCGSGWFGFLTKPSILSGVGELELGLFGKDKALILLVVISCHCFGCYCLLLSRGLSTGSGDQGCGLNQTGKRIYLNDLVPAGVATSASAVPRFSEPAASDLATGYDCAWRAGFPSPFI